MNLKKRMKPFILKITIIVILLGIYFIPVTNSKFADQSVVSSNQVTAKFWEAPVLVYPPNGTVAGLGSAWDTNPYMDWEYSLAEKPDVKYIYESSHLSATNYDGSFVSPVFVSGLLSDTIIPAPGTSNGIYYWHVKAVIGGISSPWSETWLLTVNRLTQDVVPLASPSSTPTPVPTPVSTPVPSSSPIADPDLVVINEIMWMGSTESSADEWIELRNMTDHDIDLSNWKIDHAVLGEGGHLEIPAHYTISANGYFLIANYNKNHENSALNIPADYVTTNINFNNNYSKNGALVLKDKDGNIIDSTPPAIFSAWPAGVNSNGYYKSMERKNDPGDGAVAGNWGICNVSICTAANFWNTADYNFGTPKNLNIFDDVASPSAAITLAEDKRTLSFVVSNIKNFTNLSYQLTYDTDTVSDGITGTTDLSGQDSFTQDNITLGTCSSGGTCIYHIGVENIKLTVNLEDSGGIVTVLEKTLP